MFKGSSSLRSAARQLLQPTRTPGSPVRRFAIDNVNHHPSTTTQLRRYASTDAAAHAASSRVYNFFYGTTLLLGLGIIYVYVTDTRASIHRWVVIPALRTIYTDPEEAHEVGNRSLERLWAFGLHPRERGDPDQQGDLAVEIFGQTIRNPIGTSAGIDKHADIPDPLLAIGPAIIELGGTTPLPQSGNVKPRVFRLTSQNALINRYGLNSEGADHVAQRLRQRVRHFAEACGFGHDAQGETLVLDGHAGVPPGSLTPGKLLAVNIAKNKATPENDIEAVTKDYLYCAERLAPYVDILVVNVSSPNTPGLRSLQNEESLTKILSSVVKAARSVQRTAKPAVMVKVSPDEDSDEQMNGICQAIWESDVDGIIVGNTTNKRPEGLKHLKNLSPLEEQRLLEAGGFSGPHLFEKTVSMVKKYKSLLGGTPPVRDVPPRSSSAVSSAIEQSKNELEEIAGKIRPYVDQVTDSIQTGIEQSKNKLEEIVGKIGSRGDQVIDSTQTGTEQSKDELKEIAGKLGPHGDQVTDSIQTGAIPPRNVSEKPDSEKQSLFKLPTDRFYDQPKEEQDKFRSSPGGPEAKSSSNPEPPKAEPPTAEPPTTEPPKVERSKAEPPVATDKRLQRQDSPKVIFATGGITNGKQALEVLDAGANVAMVYTALVYGGVGTISRIKDEMRHELATRSKK